jgi:hypothetical protein
VRNLGITPETTDFVTEVAASDMFEIHRANVPWQKRTEGCGFRQSTGGDTLEPGKPLHQEANASIPLDMSRAQQSTLQKNQGMIGQESAKRMPSKRPQRCRCLYSNAGKGGDNAALRSWATQSGAATSLDMAQQLDK